MGQARIRKQKLGALYGTPETSNRQARRLSSYLPQGARERNLKTIERYLHPEHLQEVRELLASEPGDWAYSYPPLPAYASQFDEVLVGCYGGLLRLGLKPKGGQP